MKQPRTTKDINQTSRDIFVATERRRISVYCRAMAPAAVQGGTISELTSVFELKEWLIGRVADDNDIVVDDLQVSQIQSLTGPVHPDPFRPISTRSWTWKMRGTVSREPRSGATTWRP